jgi:ABC-type multidrug transport system fused ATPase/permease subunit
VAVFAELRYALNALPETFIEALQGRSILPLELMTGFVSCRRIEKYMSSSEIPQTEPSDSTGDIVLNNATFAWPTDDSSIADVNANEPRSLATTPKNAFTLADMTLRFPKGQLSLICGRLGSGKSLMLNGLLGEADLVAGQMSCPRSSPDLMASFEKGKILQENWVIPGMVAYVPQQAWLQNASIKDNIVFSSPYDESRYQQVLEACSLNSDLQIMEDGDET